MHIFFITSFFTLSLCSSIWSADNTPSVKPPRLSRSELLGCTGAINHNEYDHDAIQGSVELKANITPRADDPMDVEPAPATDAKKAACVANIDQLIKDIQQLETKEKQD